METSGSETNNALLALSHSLRAAVERASPSIVAVYARPRVPTSGVLWRPGVIVSTNHTVKRDEEITVMMHDGRSASATLAGRDPGTDLAVLRLEGDDHTKTSGIAPAVDSAPLGVGHIVLALGRAGEHGVSASFGVVSAIGGAWRTWRGGEIDQLLRLDLAIYLGFSGGALIDAEGRVLGINTSGLARGAGVAIPAVTVNRVVDALLTQGRIKRGYLGIGMQPVALPEALRAQLGLPASQGLVVLSVEPEGPAGQAGVLIGDVLLALGDAPTKDTDDVQVLLGTKSVGQTIKALVMRGGTLCDLSIQIGERPDRGRRR
ncbi:MAG: S1C family serine protease [Pyrinomonadaceae bacterium]